MSSIRPSAFHTPLTSLSSPTPSPPVGSLQLARGSLAANQFRPRFNSRGEPTYVGLPPDGNVRWELGTDRAGRTVLKGPRGSLYPVPEDRALRGIDGIRRWVVDAFASGALTDYYGTALPDAVRDLASGRFNAPSVREVGRGFLGNLPFVAQRSAKNAFRPRFDSQGEPTYVGLPPAGNVRWELGTDRAGRTVLKGPRGSLYPVPEDSALRGTDGIRRWVIDAFASGAVTDYYGSALPDAVSNLASGRTDAASVREVVRQGVNFFGKLPVAGVPLKDVARGLSAITAPPPARASRADVRRDADARLSEWTQGRIPTVGRLAEHPDDDRTANAIRSRLNRHLAGSNSIGITDYKQLFTPREQRRLNTVLARSQGTARQREEAAKLASRLPRATRLEQGRPDPLEGFAHSTRHTVNKIKGAGQALAYSGVPVVGQVGEVLRFGVDAVEGLAGLIRGTPGFVQDAVGLATGKTPTTPGELAAGTVSGAGKLAYGAGAELVDTTARIISPGPGRDAVAKSSADLHARLDQTYQGAVEQAGVDPDSAGFRTSRTATQVIGTLVAPLLKPRPARRQPEAALVRTPPGTLRGIPGTGHFGTLDNLMDAALGEVAQAMNSVKSRVPGSASRLNGALSQADELFNSAAFKAQRRSGTLNPAQQAAFKRYRQLRVEATNLTTYAQTIDGAGAPQPSAQTAKPAAPGGHTIHTPPSHPVAPTNEPVAPRGNPAIAPADPPVHPPANASANALPHAPSSTPEIGADSTATSPRSVSASPPNAVRPQTIPIFQAFHTFDPTPPTQPSWRAFWPLAQGSATRTGTPAAQPHPIAQIIPQITPELARRDALPAPAWVRPPTPVDTLAPSTTTSPSNRRLENVTSDAYADATVNDLPEKGLRTYFGLRNVDWYHDPTTGRRMDIKAADEVSLTLPAHLNIHSDRVSGELVIHDPTSGTAPTASKSLYDAARAHPGRVFIATIPKTPTSWPTPAAPRAPVAPSTRPAALTKMGQITINTPIGYARVRLNFTDSALALGMMSKVPASEWTALVNGEPAPAATAALHHLTANGAEVRIAPAALDLPPVKLGLHRADVIEIPLQAFFDSGFAVRRDDKSPDDRRSLEGTAESFRMPRPSDFERYRFNGTSIAGTDSIRYDGGRISFVIKRVNGLDTSVISPVKARANVETQYEVQLKPGDLLPRSLVEKLMRQLTDPGTYSLEVKNGKVYAQLNFRNDYVRVIPSRTGRSRIDWLDWLVSKEAQANQAKKMNFIGLGSVLGQRAGVVFAVNPRHIGKRLDSPVDQAIAKKLLNLAEFSGAVPRRHELDGQTNPLRRLMAEMPSNAPRGAAPSYAPIADVWVKFSHEGRPQLTVSSLTDSSRPQLPFTEAYLLRVTFENPYTQETSKRFDLLVPRGVFHLVSGEPVSKQHYDAALAWLDRNLPGRHEPRTGHRSLTPKSADLMNTLRSPPLTASANNARVLDATTRNELIDLLFGHHPPQ